MPDDMQPITKGDLEVFRQCIEGRLDQFHDQLLKRMESWKDEITRHFDVVAESLRHDVLGANRDEVELLKDSREDHERRICRLERSTGVLIG